MKPLVYIETSVVSYLTSRPSRDLVTAAHHALTRHLTASRERMATIEHLAILSMDDDAVLRAERLVAGGLVPRESAADALRSAIGSKQLWKRSATPAPSSVLRKS